MRPFDSHKLGRVIVALLLVAGSVAISIGATIRPTDATSPTSTAPSTDAATPTNIASPSGTASLKAPTPAGTSSFMGCSIESPSSNYASRVAVSPSHAQVWRLYQAFFLRQPESSGFNYWLRKRSTGASLTTIAYQFATGPEFISRYGNLSDPAYVDLVYNNVLCRVPEASGRNYWIALLTSGNLTRWDMMINFAELREYLGNTSTCHSIYPAESAATNGCPRASLVPLTQAGLSTNGYQSYSASVTRPGGSIGFFNGVIVDNDRGLFATGADRCSVASINGNWLVPSEKDRSNPGALGIGVVGGVHVKNSSDRGDRGVFGLRFDATPTSVSEVWPGDSLSSDDRKLNSIMSSNGVTSLESWHSAAEESIYLSQLASDEIVDPDEWIWAAAGIPLILDGQVNDNFSIDYVNDPYTFQTLRHSLVMFDQDYDRLVFGATTTLDVLDLVNWAAASGYEDLIIFDGGGSTEFNVGGQSATGGTSRDIPVWLGIGC